MLSHNKRFMEIWFSNFRFLPEPLILYCDDELIPLKRNQALLLQFFLEDPTAIHSKDAIMDSVWQDKVVSEQVVFQTISQLRAILGDSAIQTFSKKGYKWQVPLKVIANADEINGVNSVNVSSDHKSLIDKRATTHKLALPFVALIAFFAILFSIQQYEKLPQQPRLSIAIPQQAENNEQITASFNHDLSQALANESMFSLKNIELKSSIEQFFLAPKHVRLQAKLTEQDWLLWGSVLPSHQGVFFRYAITRSESTWQGYVFSENIDDLQKEFIKRLHALVALNVFSDSSNPRDLAIVSSLHKQATNDAEITLLLAKYYIKSNQTDVALSYLNKVIQQSHSYANRPYQAKAYYYIGKVYKSSGHYDLAQNNFAAMEEILKDTPLHHLRFDIINANAWLAYAQGKSHEMFTILENGLSLLESENTPIRLFKLHILYSILAEKTGNHEKKYDHLNEAQALLLAHNLDASNLAIVYYHFALFNQDNNKATPYLNKILALPRTENNYWVQDQAFTLLIQNHIEEKAFSLAHELLGEAVSSPVKLVLKAKVYQAQQQNEKAISLYKEAFELARLQYDIYTGLQAALGMYVLTKHEPKTQAIYGAYLQQNAEDIWLKQHNLLIASQ